MNPITKWESKQSMKGARNASSHEQNAEFVSRIAYGFCSLHGLLSFDKQLGYIVNFLRLMKHELIRMMSSEFALKLFLGLVVSPTIALAIFLVWYFLWGRPEQRPRELCSVQKRRFSRCSFRLRFQKRSDRIVFRRNTKTILFILLQLPTQSESKITVRRNSQMHDHHAKIPADENLHVLDEHGQQMRHNASFAINWSTTTRTDSSPHFFCDWRADFCVRPDAQDARCIPPWNLRMFLKTHQAVYGQGGIQFDFDARCIPPWSVEHLRCDQSMYASLSSIDCVFSNMKQRTGMALVATQSFVRESLQLYRPFEPNAFPLLEHGYQLQWLRFILFTGIGILSQNSLFEHLLTGDFQFCDVQTLKQRLNKVAGDFDHDSPWRNCSEYGSLHCNRQRVSKPRKRTKSTISDDRYETEDADLFVDNDEQSFMQRLQPATIESCGRHLDPQIYWDRIAVRQLPLPSHAVFWVANPAVVGVLQSSPVRVIWDGVTCIRCVASNTVSLANPQQSRGPYLIRPQPPNPTHDRDRHWLYLTDHKPVQRASLLVRINLPQQWLQGALIIDTHMGLTTVPAIFNVVKPDNLCRTTSWCRIRWGTQSLWWPATFQIHDNVYLELDEIPTALSPNAIVNPNGMNLQTQAACPAGHPDPGSTMYAPEPDVSVLLSLPIRRDVEIRDTDLNDWYDHEKDELALLQLSISILISTTVGISASGPNFPFVEDEILEFDDEERSRADVWPGFSVSHGVEHPNPYMSIRVHRPNPIAVNRRMAVSFSCPHEPMPYDIFEPIFATWQEFTHDSLRWPSWKLKSVHTSFYHSGFPDIAQKEYVLISEVDQTVMNFYRPHYKAVLFHVEIANNGPAQHFLKCLRVPHQLTASQFLELDRTSTCLFEFTFRQVWHNDLHWEFQEEHEIQHGDYIFAKLNVLAWQSERANQNSIRERSRSPIRSRTSNMMQMSNVKNFSPRQSSPGESSFQTGIEHPELLANIRRVMRARWDPLGPDNQWAPIKVSHAFRLSPFLSQYAELYLLHQFDRMPCCLHQVVILTEIIEIYARVARSSEAKANFVNRQLTGNEIIIASGLSYECFNLALTSCDLTLNATPIRLEQEVQIHPGDFLQILIRHFDMHSSYEILASISLARERAVRVIAQDSLTNGETTSDESLFLGERSRQRPSLPAHDLIPFLFFAMMICGFVKMRKILACFVLYTNTSKVGAVSSREVVWNTLDLNTMDEVFSSYNGECVRDFPQSAKVISLFQSLNMGQSMTIENSLHERSIEVPVSPEELILFQQAWAGKELVQDLPSASENFADTAIDFLLQHRFADINDWTLIDSVEIYVDGSYHPESKKAAWAFLAVGRYADETIVWIGWEAAILAVDSDDPRWIGADQHNAHQAELSAIFHAAWWALSIPADIACSFHYDNQSAGHIAQGTWVPKASISLARNVRAIHQLLNVTRSENHQRKVKYQHVKAHSGHTLNDLVDVLAKEAVKTERKETLLPDIRNLINGHIPLLERYPLIWSLHKEAKMYPETVQNSLCWKVLKTTDFYLPPFATKPMLERCCKQGEDKFQITIFSYNVSTLTPAEGEFSAKAEYLRQQFSWRGADVAALQETRSRQELILDTPEYIRFVSAANKGVGGTEIWFSKFSKYQGRSLWSKQDFTVILAEKELIMVSVESSIGRLIFVSAHAPHAASATVVHETWWKTFQYHLKGLRGKYKLFVLGDFNAQLSELKDPFVGDILDDITNDNGEKLMGLCESHNLWLPSTFRGAHIGPSITWKSARCPAGKRLDYIALPFFDCWHSVISWCDFELDAGQTFEDHCAIAVQISLDNQKLMGKPDKKAIDRDSIRDPANKNMIKEILERVTPIDWNTDVHCHYDQLTQSIFDELADRFPAKRKKPRRSYLSEESWSIWQQKGTLKKTQRELHRQEHDYVLRESFSKWSGRPLATKTSRKELSFLIAFNTHLLSHLQQRLKRQLGDDREVHFARLATEVEQAEPKELFNRLRSLGIGSSFRKRGPQTLPALNTEEGVPAQTVQETQEVWRRFAADLEFGTASTPRDLWRSCVERQVLQQTNLASPSFYTLPTRTQLEWACKRISFRKATGPDGLCGEIFHMFPAECADLLQPLAIKIYCHNMEPISGKGGNLVRAWKKKGDVREPSSYRGLLISNHISKILHSICRRTILPFYESNALPLQIGGKRRARVTFAGQHVRLFMSWAKRDSFSAAALFLDVKTAFYRIVRPLIARSPILYDQITGIIERFGLPPSAMQQLLQKIDQPSTVSVAEVPASLEHLLSEFHESTWFSVPGTEHLTATKAGTRPGDPLADICFNFVFTAVIRKLHTQLAEIGVLLDLQWAGTPTIHFDQEEGISTETVMEAIWADDLALLLRSDDAEDLIPRVQRTASLLFDECLSHGLEPNLTKGKSEVVMSIRGRNSVKTRKKVYVELESKLPVQTKHWGEVELRVVPTYLHLGGRIVHTGSDAQEIFTRLAQARKLLQQYRKHLFQSRQISLERKTQLLLPLILSVLEFGMGTWTNYTAKVETRAAAQLISIYKCLLRSELPRLQVIQMSQQEVLARIQLPSWQELVHISRLRHFGGLMRDGPLPLWALIEHEKVWIERVRTSLSWLYEQLFRSIPLDDPFSDWTNWKALIMHSPSKWKGWLRRAQKHAILYRLNQWSVTHWHCVLIEKMQDIGLQPTWGEKSHTKSVQDHLCGPCNLRFNNHAAWSVHAFKLHGRTQFLRQFLTTTCCQCCSKEFWSIRRLHRHLQYMQRCASFYCSHIAPQTPPPGLNSRTQLREEPYMLAPPVFAEVVVNVHEADEAVDPETLPSPELLDALIGVFQQRPSTLPDYDPSRTMWSLVGQVRSSLLTMPIAMSHIRLTWDEFRSDWQQWVMEECSIDEMMVWKHTVDVVQWKLCAAWLVPAKNDAMMTDSSREAAFRWLETDPAFEFQHFVAPVPRAPPERFVVHLFSGRRRASDLQECLENMVCPSGIFLHVVSVDIVFGRNADLLRREARSIWLRVFSDGLVLAFYSGPPCETFSAARYNEIEGIKLRPLRSESEPWGLSCLSLREQRQLVVANMLILFTLICFLLQQVRGHFGLLEHPEPAKELFKPSIWRTRIWRLIERHHTQTICIYQGLYGAVSAKPTRLAFTPQQPSLARTMRSFQTTDTLPKQSSIGLNTSGEFKTSQLKEYPPALNRALTAVFERWHANVQLSEPIAFPADLRELLAQFEVSAETCMGPDYVPPSTALIQTA